jgi:hypothetical protein
MQIYLALTGNDRRYTKEKCLQNVLFIGDEAKWSYRKGRRNGSVQMQVICWKSRKLKRLSAISHRFTIIANVGRSRIQKSCFWTAGKVASAIYI